MAMRGLTKVIMMMGRTLPHPNADSHHDEGSGHFEHGFRYGGFHLKGNQLGEQGQDQHAEGMGPRDGRSQNQGSLNGDAATHHISGHHRFSMAGFQGM